jgi:hypothetical protein
MALTNPTPLTTEAIAPKSFPNLWLSNVTIHAPSTTAGRICIESLPFNDETGEIGSGQDMVAITTSELWLAVAEVPEVAQAMGAIFAAIDPLRAWTEARAAALLEE